MLTKDERFLKFIENSKKRFGDNFDFNNSIYVNAKTRIEIRCKEHDLIFYQTPDKHLQSTHACPSCLAENKKEPVITKTKEFKPFDYYHENLIKKHGINFTYKSGKGLNSIVYFECEIHGYKEATVDAFLYRKHPCDECTHIHRVNNKTHDLDKVLKQIQEIHPNLTFDFGENYINKRSKITINCEKHGEYIKSVQKLISGQGCPRCAIDNLIDEGILIGGYSEKLFNDKPELKNVDGILYWMLVGNYYKIGISRISATNRLKGIKNKCKMDVTILHEINMSLYEAFKFEQNFLKKHSDNRVYIECSTELFNIDLTDDFLHELTLIKKPTN